MAHPVSGLKFAQENKIPSKNFWKCISYTADESKECILDCTPFQDQLGTEVVSTFEDQVHIPHLRESNVCATADVLG